MERAEGLVALGGAAQDVKVAGVHLVTGLQIDYGRPFDVRHELRLHPTQFVGRNPLDPVSPKTKQGQKLQNGRVNFFTDNEPYPGRSKQPLVFDVASHAPEQKATWSSSGLRTAQSATRW